MKTSQDGVNFVKQFEGFRATPYKDVAGLLTIGFGHLIKPGEVFGAVSSVEAVGLLVRDLEEAENIVNTWVSVDLTQNQFDALVSFTYNLGGGRLKASTLLRKLNLGDYAGAASEFPKWDMAAGLHVPGLTRRRNAEQRLFNQK